MLLCWGPQRNDEYGLKGNLAKFGSSNISETGEAMPIKIGVHAFDINLYLL